MILRPYVRHHRCLFSIPEIKLGWVNIVCNSFRMPLFDNLLCPFHKEVSLKYL